MMTDIYCLHDAAGQIHQRATIDAADVARIASQMGLMYAKDDPAIPTGYIVDGVKTPFPEQPSAHHEWDWSARMWRDPRTIDDHRLAKLSEIDRALEAASEALFTGYPALERLTWPTQQAEALAWEAKAETPTPYLDGLAAMRGILPAEMRVRTLRVVQKFMEASRELVGTRQRLRDAALAATTQAQIEAIAWPSTTT